MQSRYPFLLRFILALSDVLLITICFFVTFYLINKNVNRVDRVILNHTIFTSITIWFLTTSLFKLYTAKKIKLEQIYGATWKSILLHALLFGMYLSLSSLTEFPKNFVITFYVLILSGFLVTRFLGTAFESILKRHFDIRTTVAVLGTNKGGLKLAAYFEQQGDYNFVGFLGDESLHVDTNGELIHATSQQIKVAANAKVKEVFVSLTPERMCEVEHLLKEAEKHCVRIKFVPDFSRELETFSIYHMDEFPVLNIRSEPLQEMKNRFKKRSFDICFSLFAIIFVLSWLYPILAIIIKWQSSGPVLYKQLRSGRDNKPFYCYKFRSMRANGLNDEKQAVRFDDRITPIGRFIRKTSLDEFPQFINVLLGNMSVVGPRPHMVEHTEQYRKIIDRYMVRQFLKPGITGWAQVKGFRGETKEIYLMEKRVEHDIWYMEHWSSMLDVRIIFMTIINVILGEENAY